jgi:hypothetical protein
MATIRDEQKAFDKLIKCVGDAVPISLDKMYRSNWEEVKVKCP